MQMRLRTHKNMGTAKVFTNQVIHSNELNISEFVLEDLYYVANTFQGSFFKNNDVIT